MQTGHSHEKGKKIEQKNMAKRRKQTQKINPGGPILLQQQKQRESAKETGEFYPVNNKRKFPRSQT